MIVDVDDDIWDEMILMLIMTLRWDDVDVDNVIMIDVCCVCTWECSDLLDIPGKGRRLI